MQAHLTGDRGWTISWVLPERPDLVVVTKFRVPAPGDALAKATEIVELNLGPVESVTTHPNGNMTLEVVR